MDRLYYFSRSTDRPPGLGSNEQVADPNRYFELSKVPNWRQILSNFWIAPFQVSGVRWNTVEHMFQAYKINLASPTQAILFSLNSGSELSRSGGEAAQKNRKMVLLNPSQLAEWERIKDQVMEQALFAKFTQNPELAKVLLMTGKAELWHGAPRTAPARQFTLEKVRDQLVFEQLKKMKILNYQITQITPRDPRNQVILFETDSGIFMAEVQYRPQENQIDPPY